MAANSTVFKATLQIADITRHYYHDHQMTIALHPSETEERMMVRLLAFALYADEELAFGRGLCVDDEATLWKKNIQDEIELWIEVGEPSESRIKKACQKAKSVVVICFSANSAPAWWKKNSNKLQFYENLSVLQVHTSGDEPLKTLVKRTMQLQFTIEDMHVAISDGDYSIDLDLEKLK